MTIQNTKLVPRLKIMVSPVRIRVPPLLKVLQNERKTQAPVSVPGPCGNNRATVAFNGFSRNVGFSVRSCIDLMRPQE
jgi:hypothetical protein